jgi:hypothetical protein
MAGVLRPGRLFGSNIPALSTADQPAVVTPESLDEVCHTYVLPG